jgi:hypothetical protein
MKNHIFDFILSTFLLGIVTSSISIAQSTNDSWAIKCGGSLFDQSKAISSDELGNVYVTGGFQSVSKFGHTSATANGDTDIFIAKYDQAGKLIWAAQAGSNSYVDNVLSESGTDILVHNNAVYATGYFLKTAKFGNQEISSIGRDDIFLAKYDLNGNLLWVKSAGGQSQDIPYSLTADNSGNIYLTGSFQKEAHFGSKSINALNATDMFIAKYNALGDLLWVKQSFSQKPTLGKVVRCQGNYCYVAGEFDGLVNLAETRLTATAPSVFIAKYNLNGEVLDAKQLNGKSDVTVSDLLLDENQIFVTGTFRNSIDFKEEQIVSKGGFDVYVAKFDNKANLVSMNTFGGTSTDEVSKLVRVNKNELVLVGNFIEDISVNDIEFRANGASDLFTFYLSNEGKFERGEIFGGPGQDQVKGALYSNSYLYTTGFFRESIIVKDQELISNGMSDILISKTRLLPNLTEKVVGEPSVYPNPAYDHFFIKSESPIISIRVFSLIGKLIFEKDDVNVNEYKVGTEGLAPGLYIIEIVNEAGFFENKLVLGR